MASPKGRGVPLYARIADELRRRIIAGDLAAGGRVPSETELCDDFGVSRHTAAQALDLLAAEGIVERRPGIGSIVVSVPAEALVRLPVPGTVIRARLPRPGEPDGVMIEVTEPGRDLRVLAAREVILVTGS